MGFNPFKAVTRAVGIPDKAATIISDVLPITALFGAAPYGFSLYKSGASLGHGLANIGRPRPSQQVHQGGTPFQTQFQPAPQYPSYYGGGGSVDYGYNNSQPAYGGSPWGYSTMYSQPSIQPSQIYSAPPPQSQDRTWEDLITGALPLFL